ncbi:MAG: tRNA pseudouridine(55) synthase TruB [Acidimicrobiia bacterium]|nr:tRNA pseudouridine(55) synthase TruB [Acidimicrobiia bacterium]
MDGVFVIDKPSGWTSHDVVGKMRRIANTRRVGHLGTLDPMATGVLPLVVNRATRLSQFYAKSEKVYDAVIRFGAQTDTYDIQGKMLGEEVPYTVTPEQMEHMMAPLRGKIQQKPPPISAKKIGGTPAYKLARKNIPVDLAPVEVTIHSMELIGCDGPEARIKVHCSAGTYLRSIAHELGLAAGCGAYLKSLVRLVSGDFTIDQAHTIEALAKLAAEGRLEEAIVPAARLLPEFPAEVVDEITAGQIRQGRDFRTSPFRVRKDARYVKALTQDGALLAIGEAKLPNVYHPIMVL